MSLLQYYSTCSVGVLQHANTAYQAGHVANCPMCACRTCQASISAFWLQPVLVVAQDVSAGMLYSCQPEGISIFAARLRASLVFRSVGDPQRALVSAAFAPAHCFTPSLQRACVCSVPHVSAASEASHEQAPWRCLQVPQVLHLTENLSYISLFRESSLVTLHHSSSAHTQAST